LNTQLTARLDHLHSVKRRNVQSITPAENPRAPARNFALANLTQKMTHAPRVVAAPAATTRPKARPTLPVATIVALADI